MLFTRQFNDAGFVDDNVYDWKKWRLEESMQKGFKDHNDKITKIKNRLAHGAKGQDRVECLTEMLEIYRGGFPDELQTLVYIGRHTDTKYLEAVGNCIQMMWNNCINPILEAPDIPISTLWSAHATVCAYARAWPVFEGELGNYRDSIAKLAGERIGDITISWEVSS